MDLFFVLAAETKKRGDKKVRRDYYGTSGKETRTRRRNGYS